MAGGCATTGCTTAGGAACVEPCDKSGTGGPSIPSVAASCWHCCTYSRVRRYVSGGMAAREDWLTLRHWISGCCCDFEQLLHLEHLWLLRPVWLY